MALINLTTNFRSLKFGGDKPGGGSSKQPFIKKEIPSDWHDSDRSNVFNTGGVDSVLRGGLITPLRVADDTSRLTQLFFTTTKGTLFTAKQNLLSRVSVKTEATQGVGYGGGNVNQGVYTPLSTLSQAASNFSGAHSNLLGLNPFSPGISNDSLLSQLGNGGLVKYESSVKSKPKEDNRLVGLYSQTTQNTSTSNFGFLKGLVLNRGSEILSYPGGPGSTLGIGRTSIKFADQRTGDQNPLAVSNPEYFYVGTRPNSRTLDNLRGNPVYGAIDYEKIDGFGGNSNTYTDVISAEGGYTWENTDAQKAYLPGSLTPNQELKTNTTPNPTDDFKSPLGNTNYEDVGGFIRNSSKFAISKKLEGNISSQGGTTWENIDAQKVYQSGSLIPSTNRLDTTTPNPTDDFISPTGSTDYKNIEGFGGSNNSFENQISKDGGTTWENVDAQKAYKSGSLLSDPNINYNTTPNPTDDFKSPLGDTDYDSLLNANIESNVDSGNGVTWENTDAQNVYNPNTLNTNKLLKSKSGWNGTTVQTQEDIESLKSGDLFPQTKQLKDFREDLEAPTDKKVLGKLNKGFYTSKNIENRVNLGDPGKSQNVTKYGVSGKVLDKITASDIYNAPIASHTGDKNDLLKFSIGIIENNSTGNSNFMHFRSFINSFNDAYSAEWGNTQYVGRGDKFYNYKGFDRTISMGFTIAAQSKAELIPMYKKLNFLASSLAPSYSSGGFMQGNLVRLTVGGYLFNQVGIIKGLTYEIPSESPWEIGINDGGGNDDSVKELPHIINVTGFQFIPIQDFVPRISNPQNQYNTRYIQLANGSGQSQTNY